MSIIPSVSYAKRFHYYLWMTTLIVCLIANINTVFADEPVGEVSFARGGIAAHHEGQESRVIGKGSAIFEGDNLQTGERSFIIINFNDGTKITVRPNSNFSVNLFSNNDELKAAKFELHQGGIRTSSGDLASKAPEDFEIKTPTSTIKAQQADYSVRVCDNDCTQNNKQNNKSSNVSISKDVVARVVDIRGLVVATNQQDTSAEERLLTLGAPLYNTDKIVSEQHGFAVIVFSDKGRITVEQSSSFTIKDYRYSNGKQEDKAIYKLISGGVRVLTGAIGKKDNEAFSINTPVATIGIRGTGFDLFHSDSVGLYSSVWQGTISQTNDSGTIDLSSGTASLISSFTAVPKIIPPESLPKSDTPAPAPRPDAVEVEDESDLFTAVAVEDNASGTFIEVHDGHVQVSNDDGGNVDLGKNESSYTDTSGETVRAESPPSFMESDPYPLPNGSFEASDVETGSLSLLNGGSIPTTQNSEDEFVCQCTL